MISRRAIAVATGALALLITQACTSAEKKPVAPVEVGGKIPAQKKLDQTETKNFRFEVKLEDEVAKPGEISIDQTAQNLDHKLGKETPPALTPPPPPPTLPPGKIERAHAESASARVTAEDVTTALLQQKTAMSSCSTEEATLSAQVLIAPSGHVAEASVVRSLPDNVRLRECVTGVLKGLSFPPSGNGASTPLQFELTVHPG